MSLLLAIACVLAGLAVTTAVAHPATARSRARAARRRAAFVAANPRHAKSADVAALLSREGLADDEIAGVLQDATSRGITAVTLWSWCEQLGVDELLTGVGHRIGDDTAPAAGPDGSEPATDVAPERPRHRAGMPEVFEPGHYPGLQVPARRSVSLSENVQRERRNTSSAA